MAKALQRLLGNDSPNFSTSMHLLERSTGHDGVDVRLIGDILEKSHAVVRELGLDVADTTARELYMALVNYVAKYPSAPLLLDTDYLLWGTNEEVVSLNLIDVIENYHHELPFQNRSLTHARRALRGELLMRYHEHPRTSKPTVIEHAQSAGIHIEDDRYHASIKKANNTGEQMQETEKPYILAVGDIFTDAFIELGEDAAKIIEEGDEKWLALPFGQKPPYERVDIIRSVGPSPNSSVSASRLGVNTGLTAWVGGDDVGREAIEHLKTEHVDTSNMVIEEAKKTSYWYVLRYGADRTMLVKSEKYNYQWQVPERMPDWVYLSYIGEDSWPLHEQLVAYLQENPDVKLAFQPGTFHFEWGVEKLRDIYARSRIVVMNREEAVDVTGGHYDDLPGLMDGLHALGPHIVVITDGPNGSYASYDFKRVRIDNYPDPGPPVDRTGAGDAFASTIVAALALGESMDTALSWAPINSMNVVQHLGAQKGLLSKEEILKHLAKAPENYGVRPLDS